MDNFQNCDSYINMKLKLKLICDRQSVAQFVWVSGLPMGPLIRFYLVLLFSADNYLIILPKALYAIVTNL
jgi:hypothetical protein